MSTEMTEAKKHGELLDPIVANQMAIFGDDDFSMFADAVDQNIEASDIRISRLALLQNNSPEVAQRVTGYDTGMWIDNVNRQIYSELDKAPWLVRKAANPSQVPLVHFARFLPICILPKEYVKWKDRNTEGNGMHWKSLDKNEQRVREGIYVSRGGLFVPPDTGSKKPPVTENINVLGYMVDKNWRPLSPELVATFCKTGFKSGKFLVGEIARHRLAKLPAWGKIYYIYSKPGVPRAGTNDSYVVPQVAVGETMYEAAGMLPEEERPAFLAYLKTLHTSIKEIVKTLIDQTVVEGSTMTVGRMMQERYINAAVDNLDDQEGEGGEDDGPSDSGVEGEEGEASF